MNASLRVMWCITTLLLSTVALADYHIDNANMSVIYSMLASQSGHAWQTYSAKTQPLMISISNSTGNYTIPVDPSGCYGENYAFGVCGSVNNCFIEVPFRGSGIAMYVFNAGLTGMQASFSVDGGKGVSKSLHPPPPPAHQVHRVKLYSIENLPTGKHTIKMILKDWNGTKTSMKFDFAYVYDNDMPVESPTSSMYSMLYTSTSVKTSTPTVSQRPDPTASNNVDRKSTVGAVLGGFTFLSGLVIGFVYLRKRNAARKNALSPDPTCQVNPFTEFRSPRPPMLYELSPKHMEAILPLRRAAILRDVSAASMCALPRASQIFQSTGSGQSSGPVEPLQVPLPISRGAESCTRSNAGLPFLDPQIATRYDLSVDQVNVINRLRQESVSMETIARVIEGFLSSNWRTGRTTGD